MKLTHHGLLFLSLLLWAPLMGIAENSEPLPVQDLDVLQEHVGKSVVVEGVVHNVFWVRNQVLMVTFQEKRGGFVAVSFARYREELNAAFDGDVVKALAGKRIQVSGVVTSHESRPQIVIETPEQVKILD